jgi:poly(hydroxyalkanoate) depolymerase family esterase
MKWSRELRIARRSMRTAIKAASTIAKAQAKLPTTLKLVPASTSAEPALGAGNVEITDFGSNPGRLAMFVHVPTAPPIPGMPLIVLLHGCGQAATTFARDTGWLALGARLGCPIVLPEQSGKNNRGRCFNWFRPTHVRRGFGEALSIRQMIAAAIQRFGSDPNRIFIAGLSAGGAMTAALLASYPDVFAAGAVIAGLPVGAASGTSEALARMAEAGPRRSRAAWAQQVYDAAHAGHAGPWPRVSIWHGEADRVVDPANGDLLAGQWSAVHDLGSGRIVTDVSGVHHQVWGEPELPAVELWRMPGLAHAWPPSATNNVARFWGLDQG